MQITVSADRHGAPVSEKLYGIFLEDINYGCDGGLYAELIANRCFENVDSAGIPHRLMHWTPLGGAMLAIRTQAPRGEKNPHYLRMTSDATASWGVRNEGYLGQGLFAAENEAYRLTVIGRADAPCALCASLVSEDGEALASAPLSLSSAFEKQTILLRPQTAGVRAYLTLTLQGQQSVDLDFVSLFPVHTFKGRENGARADLAQALADLKPAFLRFPGGCIVEGRSYENMYRFRETLGPIEERRTNWNRWQMDEYQIHGRSSADYYQTYGMGFYEFFVLCEDIGARPLPILNCGLTCQWHEGLTIPLDQMDGIVQDYLDLIEFCNGSAETPMGAVRAQMGHPQPFGLEMIGVGNEQWDSVYFERYEIIHRAVKAQYPEIELIGCAGWTDHGWEIDAAQAWMRRTDARPDYADEHYYKRVDWFFENADRYAHYDEGLPRVFAGEYAAHAATRANTLHAALAEAAFLTGLENASPRVAMACYAPLLARVGANQWQPDLIWFDQSRCYLTPSYHVQRLFSLYRGDRLALVEAQIQPEEKKLYLTASWRDADGALLIKAVNPDASPATLHIALPPALAQAHICAQVLRSDDLNAENTPERPCCVVPFTREDNAQNGAIDWTFESQSVSVLCIRPALS